MNASTATIAAVRTFGNIIIKNENVSASTIITSMKLSDIQSTSNLKRETTISKTNRTSDSAAASAGRRSSTSHRPFKNPQASTNTAIDSRLISLQSMIASATTWNSATGAIRLVERRASIPRSGSRPGCVGDRIVMVVSWPPGGRALEPLDQAGIDQHAIETSRLGSAIAIEKQSVAALHDLLLLLERGVERQARGLEDDKRKIRAFDGIERAGHIGRFEIDCVDRVVGGEIARVVGRDPLGDRCVANTGLEDLRGKFRCVIAVTDDQELLVREFALEASQEGGVVAHTERLAAQILVDAGRVAEALPLRRQLRAPAPIPRKVIGGEIDVDEGRAVAALACDDAGSRVVVIAVGLELGRADRGGIHEMLDAGGLLEPAGAHEGAVRGIERIGLIAAPVQRTWQPALDPAGRDTGDEIGEPAVGARRKAGEHIVFGIPARPAGPLRDEFALLAVERAEVGAVVGRHVN